MNTNALMKSTAKVLTQKKAGDFTMMILYTTTKKTVCIEEYSIPGISSPPHTYFDGHILFVEATILLCTQQ